MLTKKLYKQQPEKLSISVNVQFYLSSKFDHKYSIMDAQYRFGYKE